MSQQCWAYMYTRTPGLVGQMFTNDVGQVQPEQLLHVKVHYREQDRVLTIISVYVHVCSFSEAVPKQIQRQNFLFTFYSPALKKWGYTGFALPFHGSVIP